MTGPRMNASIEPLQVQLARQGAIQIATETGHLLRDAFRQPLKVRAKTGIELVTEVDLAAETLIRRRLRERFPADAILGEEEGGAPAGSGRTWVVDPLDGTTNFIHGVPIFSVSIALCVDGSPVAGAVCQPVLGQVFSAGLAAGADCNGVPLAVSPRHRLEDALAVTGFPYDLGPRFDSVIERFRRMLAATRGMRRFGSAAMDLCYVAAGYVDLFWEVGLRPWDVAAGMLLVTEAGGMVTRYDGSPMGLASGELLATNGHLHAAASALLR